MLSTLMVIGGVLVGLLALLALIVGLSARPATRPAPGPSSWAEEDDDHVLPGVWSPSPQRTPSAESPAA